MLSDQYLWCHQNFILFFSSQYDGSQYDGVTNKKDMGQVQPFFGGFFFMVWQTVNRLMNSIGVWV